MTDSPSTGLAPELATAAVVVGVDDSRAALLATRWAAGVAGARNWPLHIVHGLNLGYTGAVTEPDYALLPEVFREIQQDGTRAVDAARRAARRAAPQLRITTEISMDDPRELLPELSASAHMLVIGSPGDDEPPATRLGSTLIAVTSRSHGPVVAVRRSAAEGGISLRGPVVVGVDGTAHSDPAIAAAFAEASWRKCELVALHVWSDLSADAIAARMGMIRPPHEMTERAGEVLTERLAGWAEKYPDVKVRRMVRGFSPRAQLLDLSRVAQLIVVGSRGRGHLRGLLLGSVSNSLVQQAHCPVMVVRA